MYKKKIVIGVLLVACVGITLNGCSFSKTYEKESISESDGMIYESEEDIIENLKPGESGYTEDAYYISAFHSSALHMRIVDTDGVVQEPVYEMKVTEDNEIISDQEEYQGTIYYVPVFKFVKDDSSDIKDLTVSKVCSAGLTYWVDEEGNTIYTPQINSYRFPVKSDNRFSTGEGYDEEVVKEQENGSEFLELFSAWMEEVHESGEIIEKGTTLDSDKILQYDAEYPDYYEVLLYADEDYECYVWPVGVLSIEIREASDGKYEIVEKRNYYLDKDFLENTPQYDEEILKEKAKDLSVNVFSNVGDAIESAREMNASSLNLAVDETVVYLAEMPDELKEFITDLQETLNPE